MGTVTSIKNSGIDSVRYVRVTERDRRGYVNFQFSIGDPNLYLEMTLPESAFEEFCTEHNARELSDEQIASVDLNERRWRYGDDEQDD